MLEVEVFSSPGCAKCTQAKNLLKAIVEEMGQGRIAWRDVNILNEMDYAVGLGIMSSAALAIDGKLVFSSLPSPDKLRAELGQRLA